MANIVSPPTVVTNATSGNIGASLTDGVMGQDAPNKKDRFGIVAKQSPGRPKDGGVRRQGGAVKEFGDERAVEWDLLPERIRRKPQPSFDFSSMTQIVSGENKQFMHQMNRVSPQVAQALRLLKRLVNTGLVYEVKKKDPKTGKFTVMDDDAIKLIKSAFDLAGEMVISDIPGAAGSIHTMTDTLIEQGVKSGAICVELALKNNRKDVFGIFPIDANTIEFRRDYDFNGMYRIGQITNGAANNWKPLNANLVTYRQLNSYVDGPYGNEEYESGHVAIPLMNGYFGKLALFMQRAAFGFLDGEVNTELLTQMWQNVDEEVKSSFNYDALSWMDAVAKYLAQSYADQQEGDPDAIAAHLDLLTIKGEASGKAAFPIDGANPIKQEVYSATGTPGELLGEKSSSGDVFAQLKIEGYHSYLRNFQKLIGEIYSRVGYVILWAQAWPEEVEVNISFKPIPIYPRLTTAQAEQLEFLISRMKRDENLITQNDFSREVTGSPAVGSAPMSGNADPDGPSAPSPEFLSARFVADQQQKGFASGTANPSSDGKVGGADKQRQTNPSSDKKV